MTIDQIMQRAPVIPVLVLDGVHDPVELAAVLVEAGLPVIEVTLRTTDAIPAIEAMSSVPGAIVGAGTIINERQLDQALEAGAQFLVSPGLTETLVRAAEGVAYLPGVYTPGDIMRGIDVGLSRFKFFPATAAGGIPALKALSAPFADLRFCPTGGITADTAMDWLALDAVTCIGGSWIVPKGANLSEIGALAKQAASF